MDTRIEDYALIGDCETAALVGRDGSIDWLCWPRFDSAACFAALLGEPENGRWRVAPVDAAARPRRRYQDGTLVLETDWETATGAATVIDFMPLRGASSDLVRLVVGRRGRVAMRSELVLRFDYGATVPWVTRLDDGGVRAVAGPHTAVLRSGVPLRGENLRTIGEFEVAAGDSVAFCLSYASWDGPEPQPLEPQAALAETQQFWQEWSGRCRHEGDWREAVVRSQVTLKALTYHPTGAVIAAPTTSLPELIGGTRNWDYRFCWLRDATFTLLSLMNAGYRDEAAAWREWLLRSVAGSPAQTQIMYGVAGERRLAEWELPWLPGYAGSKPVRVGNAAVGQCQLDVFGEVCDALHQARRGGLGATDAGWALECALVEHVTAIWDQPDEGLWEVRGGRRHFTHSKVMAWVALDRAIQSAQAFGLQAPLERWQALRTQVHAEVCRQGYDDKLGSFVQSYGSQQLDASLLLIPLVGFLPPEDPRVRGTLAAIEQRLLHHGFVLRYDSAQTQDGLPPGEGAFLACSFWFVDNLALQGRQAEARAMFERLLAIRNDVGLLAEEYDPVAKRQLGNFPQAFSHLALSDSAHALSMPGSPAEQRAQRVAP
ncbi:MAG TPA: glycoside hydrolase family 15 protein [Ramlibacter sp.]|nr:glycoside hydrolase family 15 protein [Ramlibacter sp.]